MGFRSRPKLPYAFKVNLKFWGYNDPDAKAAEKYVKAIIDKFNGQGTKTISKLLEIATETIPSKRT